MLKYLLVLLFALSANAQTIEEVTGEVQNGQVLHIQGLDLLESSPHVCFYSWCVSQERGKLTDTSMFLKVNVYQGDPATLHLVLAKDDALISRPLSKTTSWDTPVLNHTKLRWEPSTTEGANYRLYISQSEEPGTEFVAFTKDTLNYHISNLSQGTWYFFISAVNSEGESDLLGPATKIIN